MTTPPTAPAERLLPSARTGLTATDAERIAVAVEAELAASTRETYGCGWRQWERWCQGRGIRPLPAPPAAVAAFLAERAEAGVHFSTLDCYCSGIAYRHRQEGLADPPPTSSSDASAEDCAGSSGSPRSARLTR